MPYNMRNRKDSGLAENSGSLSRVFNLHIFKIKIYNLLKCLKSEIGDASSVCTAVQAEFSIYLKVSFTTHGLRSFFIP